MKIHNDLLMIWQSGLLNSRPKGVLAGRPAKSGRKWPKVAKSGQKWPKLNKAILKPLNHTNKVHNVTITYNTNIIFILVQYYFPQTPGRLTINTKLFNNLFSNILIDCTSYAHLYVHIQCLYSSLFSYKSTLLLINILNYPKIGQNHAYFLKYLVSATFGRPKLQFQPAGRPVG